MEKGKEQPIKEVTLPFGGAVLKAVVWKHGDAGSQPHFSVSFKRSYRNQDKWSTSEFFGRDDLLGLARLAEETHRWIIAHGKEASDK